MGFGIFLLFVRMILLCFLAYLGMGYGCIRLYEMMTFYVPFSKELVSGGVYHSSTHRKLMRSYATPLIVMLLGATVLTVLLIIFTPMGWLAAIACFAAGIIVYYQARQGKKVMIRRFVHQFRRHMDETRLDALLQQHYGMNLAELPAHTK